MSSTTNVTFTPPTTPVPEEDTSLAFQSANPHHRIVLEYLDIDDVYVDPEIQRGEETSEIRDIVNNFNEAALGTLTAADTGNGKSLLDGQQRTAALRLLRAAGKWGPEKRIRVLVHYGLSRAEQARLFLDLNYRRSVVPLRRFKTRLVAQEESALRIKEILDELGIHLSTGPKGFQAVTTADRIIVQENGPERLRWSLRMIKEIYDSEGKGGCWDGRLLEAFGLIHSAFIAHIDEERMIKKLLTVGDRASKIIGAGRTRQEVMGGQISYNIGMAIINYYESSTHSNTKYPRRLGELPRGRAAATLASEQQESSKK